MRILCGILLCGWTAAIDTPAARAEPIDLTPNESVRLGIKHNARLRAVRADADAARAARDRVRATRRPSVRSSASYTRLFGDIPEIDIPLPEPFAQIPRNWYHAEATADYVLFSASRGHRIRSAEHQAEAASLVAEQTESDVAFEVRRVYWQLYRAIAIRDAIGAALAEVEAHVESVRERVEAGAALRTELLAARSRRAEVRVQQVEAENAVRVGQLELNRLIGLPLATEVRPVRAVESLPPPPALPRLTREALADRPQLGALAKEVSARRAEVAAARGERFPEISLFGRGIYARPNPVFLAEQGEFRGSFELGVRLGWTLWEGGRRRAQEREAGARLRASEARLREAREIVEVEVARQVLEVRRASEAVSAARDAEREAAESLRVTREQFDEGVVLSVRLLEAEQSNRAAQANLADALADHAIARAALLHARGLVW